MCIRDSGLYTVKIHLHAEIDAELKVWVVPSVTSETPAGEKQDKADKSDKAKAEKPKAEKAEKPKAEKADKPKAEKAEKLEKADKK